VQDTYFSTPEVLPLVLEFARTGGISRDRVGRPLELSAP
jgi:hypothetical protein